MVGKLTTILAKKEAETYLTHGLHKEALAIYKKLLSSCPNLENGFKDAVQGRIQEIQSELDETPTQENQKLSLAEIMRIRKGWGAAATEGDLLVCAQALCQVGHYQYAFEEVVRLLQKGCTFVKVIGLLADCLVHLRTPQQIPKSLDRLTQKLFKQSKAALELQMLLAQEMVKFKQTQYALVIYQHLQKDPHAAAGVPGGLAAIADAIETLQAMEKTEGRRQSSRLSAPCAETTGEKNALGWFSAVKNRFLNRWAKKASSEEREP